ncbi:MAG TPA: hypothetical protein VHB46_11050 [Burkholderiales bacterium]|nr:hypothetical protein [Burkholderiales bacterium]
MNTRIALLYAGALLAALPPPANAAARKAECTYRLPAVSAPAEREPSADPAQGKLLLAESQRRLLIAAAMKGRAVPDALLVEALSQVVAREAGSER